MLERVFSSACRYPIEYTATLTIAMHEMITVNSTVDSVSVASTLQCGANAHWRSSSGGGTTGTADRLGGGDGGRCIDGVCVSGVAGASIAGSSSTVALNVHFAFGIVCVCVVI